MKWVRLGSKKPPKSGNHKLSVPELRMILPNHPRAQHRHRGISRNQFSQYHLPKNNPCSILWQSEWTGTYIYAELDKRTATWREFRLPFCSHEQRTCHPIYLEGKKFPMFIEVNMPCNARKPIYSVDLYLLQIKIKKQIEIHRFQTIILKHHLLLKRTICSPAEVIATISKGNRLLIWKHFSAFSFHCMVRAPMVSSSIFLLFVES